MDEPMWEHLTFGDGVYKGQRLFLPGSPDCVQVEGEGRIYSLTPEAICVGHKYTVRVVTPGTLAGGHYKLELRIVKYTPANEPVLIATFNIEDMPELVSYPMTAPNFLLFTTDFDVAETLVETECTSTTKLNSNAINSINSIQKHIRADTLGVIFSFLGFTAYQRHELKSYCLLFRDALPGVSYWTVNFPHLHISTMTVLMEKIQEDERVKNETLVVVEFPEGQVVLDGEKNVSCGGVLDCNLSPTRDNITFVGKGKDRTVVFGYVDVDNKKNVVFRDFSLVNQFGGVCMCVGHDSNSLRPLVNPNQKACVELYDMSLRHLQEEQGDDALCIENGATVIAKRCEFANVGGNGVDIKGKGTKAMFYNCAICNNGATGICVDDGALVELYGEDTIIHTNEEDNLQCWNGNNSIFSTNTYEGISSSIVIYIPSLVMEHDLDDERNVKPHVYKQLSSSSLRLTKV